MNIKYDDYYFQIQNTPLSNIVQNNLVHFINDEIEILDTFRGNLRSNTGPKVNTNGHSLTPLTKVPRCLSTNCDISVMVHDSNVLVKGHSNQLVVELQIFETRVFRST